VVQLLLLLAVVGGLALGPAVRAEAEPTSAPAPAVWIAAVPGRYYLTPDKYDGAGALTACTDGYHMASLWEVVDVSNLTYDTILGVTTADSGDGPPTDDPPEYIGWIRTGEGSNTGSVPGQANCAAWTSNGGPDNGTAVRLPTDWSSPASDIGIWDVGYTSCSTTRRVWCVRPPLSIYLPLVLRDY
jgi:hypothetical protein